MNYKLINNKIMNITKAIAEDIADKMIKPMVDHQIAQETKMKEYCTLIILGNVPVSIQKEYKAHKEYFQHLSNAYLCNGNAQIYVSVEPFKVPLNNRSYRYECTKEQYDYIVKMEKDISNLISEKRKIKESIMSTLLSLRTIKRVIEQFPDAAPFAKKYQKGTTTAVSVPIETINKTLNKYKK